MQILIPNKLSFLKEPYPFGGKEGAYKGAIGISLFIAAFLVVFKPFGLNSYRNEEVYLIIGYGVVCFLTFLLNTFLVSYLLKDIYREESWKVYHQIIWSMFNLLMLGFTNFFYAVAIGAFSFTLTGFLRMESFILLTSIIPITGTVLLRYFYHLKKNLRQARAFTEQLLKEPERQLSATIPQEDQEFLILTADNGKDTFRKAISEICFIESVENYIEIYWVSNDKMNKTLLRSTLYKTEERVRSIPSFFRCHRSFIVNMDRVKWVRGNSQGYQLVFPDLEQTVPVARSKNKELKAHIYSGKLPQ